MITSNIGRKFLVAYNEKNGTDYDAKTFFTEKFYPLFFGHPKYLMTAGNSPLENPKISWEPMILGKKDFETSEQRRLRYSKLIDKIESGDADASVAIGFQASDKKEFATTSGQVSNVGISVSKDDVYLSWIGAGLGVGVQGGFCILIDNVNILLDISEGWEVYRTAVNQTSNLKGNQINSWNGQWIAHRYSRNFIQDFPLANFSPFSEKDEFLSVDTKSWTKIMIALALKTDISQLIGYVYNIGQTNTTVGFIPFNLEGIRSPVMLYERFFGVSSGKKAEELWGTAIGFRLACRFGSVGIRAMEPKGFKDYITGAKLPKYGKNGQQIINFNVYKIWVMAMLNNEELWNKSEKLAELLSGYASSGERGKTEHINRVKAVLESTNKVKFIKNLTEIVEDSAGMDKIVEVAKIVNSMPADNVSYFLTLVRFNYVANQNKLL